MERVNKVGAVQYSSIDVFTPACGSVGLVRQVPAAVGHRQAGTILTTMINNTTLDKWVGNTVNIKVRHATHNTHTNAPSAQVSS